MKTEPNLKWLKHNKEWGRRWWLTGQWLSENLTVFSGVSPHAHIVATEAPDIVSLLKVKRRGK